MSLLPEETAQQAESTEKQLSRTETRFKVLAERFANAEVSRRGLLKFLAFGVDAAAVAKPSVAKAFAMPELFRAHYKELTAEDKAAIMKRIEQHTKEDYGADATVKDYPAQDGVKFGYALNLSKCNGNRECVYACLKENNQSRDPQIAYIQVLEMENGSFDMDKGRIDYDHEQVPQPGKFYMPVQCNKCENPPCVKACPVEATWQEKDGIVAIDYDWCIGCRYCMSACPYGARHFNFTDPVIPKEEINPNQGFLSNRIRPRGVVEKCTFCSHRTREGRLPACAEACPTGARKFGNLLDPNSEVSIILQTKRVFVLKEELNTMPRFYYFFD